MTTPILTASSGTIIQCARYICAKPHGEYSEYDIGQIVKSYFEVCTRGGVDPVMLIAQAIHECANFGSWWAARPRRNPAGVGVTGQKLLTTEKPKGAWEKQGDTWLEGVAFSSWATGSVPAHVGRVLAYALADGQGTAWQHKLIGDALAIRPLPASYRGAAPTWDRFDGRWAVPGVGYHLKLFAIAERIRTL